MLHILAENKFETLKICLQIINQQEQAALLLYQDAVYLALLGTEFSQQLTSLAKEQPLYLIAEDVLARGLKNQIINQVNLIDYQRFVELTIEYGKTVSW